MSVCLAVYLSARPPVCLFVCIRVSICLLGGLSIYLFYMFISAFLNLCDCACVRGPVCLSAFLLYVNQHVYNV